MRIRTNATEANLREAARNAGVSFARLERHGSRTHTNGFDVTLEGSSNRRANGGYGGAVASDGYAATWDEWGVFLAGVFAADYTTITTYYYSRDDFHHRTGRRYTPTGLAEGHKPCRNHRWVASGANYNETHCAKGCGAERNYLQRVG